jgi:hypothetical protein
MKSHSLTRIATQHADALHPRACLSRGCSASSSKLLQTARKPNFVLDDHSSRPAITDRLQQPTRKFRNCTLPLGASGRCAPAAWEERCRTPCLFGLAPCGVYHAVRLTPHPVRSYRTFSPLPAALVLSNAAGGIFSVALAVEMPSQASLPDVIRHTALRSSDFPPPANTLLEIQSNEAGSDRPAACSSKSNPAPGKQGVTGKRRIKAG